MRIAYIDWLKAMAIATVFVMHATEYSLRVFDPTSGELFLSLGYVVGRIGVPLFVMVSGALLLPRDYEKPGAVTRFYKRNWLPLLVVTEVWIIIYNLFNWAHEGIEPNVAFVMKQCLFLEGIDQINMWYMPMILGLYLAIPFVSIVLRRVDLKTLALPAAIAIAASFLLPSFGSLSTALGSPRGYSSTMDVSFFGGSYGAYLVLGYCIHEKHVFPKGALFRMHLARSGLLRLSSDR